MIIRAFGTSVSTVAHSVNSGAKWHTGECVDRSRRRRSNGGDCDVIQTAACGVATPGKMWYLVCQYDERITRHHIS
ncbi:hypothetical protein FRX31_025918 [Thalictrum thalictroides]|uniref:Uncharacterized protein n=1 Tax=Thalictrum thalictroides TaxID=46969 RepID=A0A7J6VJW7_THATH|nr:hypothetical protein FRX31_025918 [Thalictrum thalictroides]